MDAAVARRLQVISTQLSPSGTPAPTAAEADVAVEADVVPSGSSFESLGVQPLINAQGHITTLGGSLMPAPVVEAMARASRSFVQLNELHTKAGEHIARLVGAPAAFVCNGAASGMFLSGAAVLSGGDTERARALPDTSGRPSEFVISQVEGWHETIGQGFVMAGGKLVKVGTASTNPTAADYAAAITAQTAAVVFFKGTQTLEDLSAVVAAAHARGVPVIVDCAAQLPPKSNLTSVLASGADLAVFSGGKGFMGPQASGLVIGSPEMVAACRACSAPNGGPGRAQKVGKEEIMGLVAAVELFVATDEAEVYAEWYVFCLCLCLCPSLSLHRAPRSLSVSAVQACAPAKMPRARCCAHPVMTQGASDCDHGGRGSQDRGGDAEYQHPFRSAPAPARLRPSAGWVADTEVGGHAPGGGFGGAQEYAGAGKAGGGVPVHRRIARRGEGAGCVTARSAHAAGRRSRGGGQTAEAGAA
jgi:uncharacterized pyridoxal phosphate-dependent enzyme